MQTVEITRNEKGKLEITVNGKKMKRSFCNAYQKAMETSYFMEYHEGGIAHNPWGGMPVELTGFEMTVYMWVVRWFDIYQYGQKLSDHLEYI